MAAKERLRVMKESLAQLMDEESAEIIREQSAAQIAALSCEIPAVAIKIGSKNAVGVFKVVFCL